MRNCKLYQGHILRIKECRKTASNQPGGVVAQYSLMVKPGGKEPNGELAKAIVRRAVEKGLLMFAPVGFGGATVKICPPLCINEEASAEAVHVLEECIEESV